MYHPLVYCFDFLLLSCQEDLPANSLAGFNAFNATLEFPFLKDRSPGSVAFDGACQGVPPSPREGVDAPVVSDIPTPVLYGSNDTQTAANDGSGPVR